MVKSYRQDPELAGLIERTAQALGTTEAAVIEACIMRQLGGVVTDLVTRGRFDVDPKELAEFLQSISDVGRHLSPPAGS